MAANESRFDVLYFSELANGEKLHQYKLKEYKQTLMLNYLKVIDRLQIPLYDISKFWKKVEIVKFITTALKSILKWVKLQSLVANCCKTRKI